MPRKSAASEGSDKAVYEALWKSKEEIIDKLQKPEDIRKLTRKIKVEAEDDPLKLEEQTPIPRIMTGTALDRIFSAIGGIEAGSTVLVYGYPETGKTQIVEAVMAEAKNLIIEIDSEHTFRAKRFIEICKARGKDPAEISKRLRYYHPDDWIEQESVIQNLPEFNEKGELYDVGVVVIDSIVKHWTAAREFHGRDKMGRRAQMFRAELTDLAAYARRHGAVLLMTSQVYEVPDANRFSSLEQIVRPPMGPTFLHFPDYVIFIRKVGSGNARIARLVGSPDLPQIEVPFILDTSGIRDIPDPKDRMEAFEQTEKYGQKFLSGKVAKFDKEGESGEVKKSNNDKIKIYFRKGVISLEEAKKFLSEEEILEVQKDIEDEIKNGPKLQDALKDIIEANKAADAEIDILDIDVEEDT